MASEKKKRKKERKGPSTGPRDLFLVFVLVDDDDDDDDEVADWQGFVFIYTGQCCLSAEWHPLPPLDSHPLPHPPRPPPSGRTPLLHDMI
jgi:hypothetical protein